MANATLGAVLHHIRAAVDLPSEAATSDGLLLARFVARRDEEAFAPKVAQAGEAVTEPT